MIDPKAEPIGHRSPYKRIDLGRKRPTKPFISRCEVEDNLEPVPDPTFYEIDFVADGWRLKP